MPKPDWYPELRIKARWNRNIEQPSFLVGLWPPRDRPRYVTLPFETSNAEIYRLANLIALDFERDEEFHFQVRFNRNYLYSDLQKAKREHYVYQTPPVEVHERLNNNLQDYLTAFERRQKAEELALELLTNLTSPEFAAQVAENKPFYFNTARCSYIIDPSGKNVIRLDTEFPVGLCIYFTDHEVQNNKYDWAIGIYLYLVGAEKHLHDTANEYRYLRGADWRTTEIHTKYPDPVVASHFPEDELVG